MAQALHSQQPSPLTQHPPGSIVSKFGIRRYYSVDTPSGLKGKQPVTSGTGSEPGNAGRSSKPTTNNRTQSEPTKPYKQPLQDSRRPVVHRATSAQAMLSSESATQTDVKSPVTTQFTQTDELWKRQAVVVDATTSPVFMKEEVRSNTNSGDYHSPDYHSADYRRVLSKASNDIWDERKSISLLFDEDEVGSLPTPYPIRNRAAVRENKDQETQVTPVPLKSVQATPPLVAYPYSSAYYKEPKRTIVRHRHPQQPPPPIYIVQNATDDSNSDDEPAHHVYGPTGQILPTMPSYMPQYGYSNHTLPNIYQNQGPHRTQADQERSGTHQMEVQLRYGYITNGLGELVLPIPVQEELLSKYGHIRDTQVTIFKHNGNYTIHSHSQGH